MDGLVPARDVIRGSGWEVLGVHRRSPERDVVVHIHCSGGRRSPHDDQIACCAGTPLIPENGERSILISAQSRGQGVITESEHREKRAEILARL